MRYYVFLPLHETKVNKNSDQHKMNDMFSIVLERINPIYGSVSDSRTKCKSQTIHYGIIEPKLRNYIFCCRCHAANMAIFFVINSCEGIGHIKPVFSSGGGNSLYLYCKRD